MLTYAGHAPVALAQAQTNSAVQASPVGKGAPAATPVKPAGPPSGATLTRFSRHAAEHYAAIWGVDALRVRIVESGQIVRFSWRVVDAARAASLSDKRATPSLEDPKAGVSLVVPTMENIGDLRQTQTPETGQSYWMVFSNKGRLVKQGHRVNVVIGSFRADGLIVE
jgi:hypothetical protein